MFQVLQNLVEVRQTVAKLLGLVAHHGAVKEQNSVEVDRVGEGEGLLSTGCCVLLVLLECTSLVVRLLILLRTGSS